MSAKTFLTLLGLILVAPVARSEDSSERWVLMHRALAPATIDKEDAPGETVTIPALTEACIEVLSGIHSRVSHVDDPVRARLIQPVYINGYVALPSGTLLDGRITRIRNARRMRRSAELAFRFEHITLPDGQTERIRAALTSLDSPSPNTRLDPEGYFKGTRVLPWKGIAGGLGILGTLGAVKIKVAGAAALAPWLPVGGSALAGYALLWPRGNDVHVPPETRVRIRLDQPLTVRVRW